MTAPQTTDAQLRDALAESKRALAEARSDAEIAAIYLRECDAAIALESRASEAALDPPSVRAAMVFRGRLSPERALEEALRLGTGRAEALEALLDVLRDEQLSSLFDPPFRPMAITPMVALQEVERRGLAALRLERAPPGSIRSFSLSWAELCARSTEPQREAARGRIDEALATAELDGPAVLPEQINVRARALRWLIDRALLDPPATRGPALQRAIALLDANERAILAVRNEWLAPALAAIAALECGELALAVSLFTRALPWIDSVFATDTPASAQFEAALIALQQQLTAEQLEQLERAIVLSTATTPSHRPFTWLRLARIMRSSHRAFAMERAVNDAVTTESWSMVTYNDVPLEWIAPRARALAEELPRMCAQLVRGGRSYSEISARLRVIPSHGPWVESLVPSIEAMLLEGPHATPYETRFTFEWLFEAARRGHARAESALLAVVGAGRMPWFAARQWYRRQREAFVDAVLAARHRRRETPAIASWLRTLLLLRDSDRARLTDELAPALDAMLDDGFLLQMIAPFVRAQDAHRVACAALDAHTREPTMRQAKALLALANAIDDRRLAGKCLRRYVHQAPEQQFDRAALARATARLGDDPRVRRALETVYRRSAIPLEFLPPSARIEAIANATPSPALWSSLAVAVEGMPAALLAPALARALARLVEIEQPVPRYMPFAALLPWFDDDTLLALCTAQMSRVRPPGMWVPLLARIALSRPEKIEPALVAFDKECSATPNQPSARLAKNLLARLRGDETTFARAIERGELPVATGPTAQLLVALRWLDEAAVAMSEAKVPLQLTNFVQYSGAHLDSTQRARLATRIDEHIQKVSSRFDLDRFAPYATRQGLARAWSRRVTPSSNELPLRHVTLALAGPEGLDHVCAQIARELAR